MIYNDDDVCDFDANYVGSSYNPSDGNMPDGLKTFLNERVDKPQSEVLTLHAPNILSKPIFYHYGKCLEMAHWMSHQPQQP